MNPFTPTHVRVRRWIQSNAMELSEWLLLAGIIGVSFVAGWAACWLTMQ